MHQRALLALAVGASLSLAVPAAAADPAYPTKPIRLIVPNAVGGTSDITGRQVGAALTEILGVQVVVDNRGGAGGTVGTTLAAQAQPDGYTVLLSNIALAVNETLRPNRTYRAQRDLAPISLAGHSQSVLVVHPSSQYGSVAALLDGARATPSKITFGTAGAGSSSHLAMAYLMSVAKVDLLHVPYKGGGPAVQDLVAGQIQTSLSPVPTVFGHVEAKRLRALGVSGKVRVPVLPEVPTIAEGGVPGFTFTTWFGLSVPAGTPRPVIDRLNRATVQALTSPETSRRLQALGLDPDPGTPEAYGRFIQAQIDLWRKVVAEAKIPLQK